MSARDMSFPLTEREMMDLIGEWLDDINAESNDDVILVEGKNDVSALRSLGIEHTIIAVNKGMNTFDLVEHIKRGKPQEMEGPLRGKIIILSDWDRKGGHLASRIKKACLHLDVDFDLDHRKKMVLIIGKWIKDVESIPSFISSMVHDRSFP